MAGLACRPKQPTAGPSRAGLAAHAENREGGGGVMAQGQRRQWPNVGNRGGGLQRGGGGGGGRMTSAD
jgi:hypothetical protein